jgi:hypothetical protein
MLGDPYSTTIVLPRPSSERPYASSIRPSVRRANAARFTRKFTKGPTASAAASHSFGSNASATSVAICCGARLSALANGKHGSVRSARSRSLGTVTARRASSVSRPARAATETTASLKGLSDTVTT